MFSVKFTGGQIKIDDPWVYIHHDTDIIGFK